MLKPKYNRPKKEVDLIYKHFHKDYKTICSGYDPKWFAKGTKLVMYFDKECGTVLNAIENLEDERYNKYLIEALKKENKI